VYNTYHLINKEPFLNKPSPSVFFDSSTHSKAWEFLKANIDSEEPAVMVTGNYGVGKTVLCLKLVEELKQCGHSYVYVSTPMQSYLEVLLGICKALKIKGIAAGSDEDELHRAIYKYLDSKPDARIVIIVDDVQEHNSKTLNKIRLLANYTREGDYSIRLFLFGSPAFVQRLKALDMEPLDQRIKRRFEVLGLDFADTKEYIYFRLIHAGAKGSPFFTDAAIRKIVDATGGILRKTNNLCDMCLQIGASRGIEDIDHDLVDEALLALGWDVDIPANADKEETPVATTTNAETPVAPQAESPAVSVDTANVTAGSSQQPSSSLKLHSDEIAPANFQQPVGMYHPSQVHGAGLQSPANGFGGTAGMSSPTNLAHGQQQPAPFGSYPPGSQPQAPGQQSHPFQSQVGQSPNVNPAVNGVSNGQTNVNSDVVEPAAAESKWSAWLFRGLVVFLLLAIFGAVLMKETNVAG